MKIVDLNLLIYAVNSDAPDHIRAKAWLENTLSETETVGLPWAVILGFLRITTNSRIMPKPIAHQQAVEVIDGWLDRPTVEIILPTDRHWVIFKQLISNLGTAANLTTDAHLAALAIERGAVLYSTDNDFSRFPKLKWCNPL